MVVGNETELSEEGNVVDVEGSRAVVAAVDDAEVEDAESGSGADDNNVSDADADAVEVLSGGNDDIETTVGVAVEEEMEKVTADDVLVVDDGLAIIDGDKAVANVLVDRLARVDDGEGADEDGESGVSGGPGTTPSAGFAGMSGPGIPAGSWHTVRPFEFAHVCPIVQQKPPPQSI